MLVPKPATILDIYPHDTWFFALCGLATEKNVRGDILIGNVKRISYILRNLDQTSDVSLHVAMRLVPGGFFSDDVADWMSRLEILKGPNAVVADAYEKGFLKISSEIHLTLLESVISKVRFADRDSGEFQAVISIAAKLKQAALLEQMAESLDQRIRQLYDTEKDIELLKVLIPLTCMSFCNSDRVMIHPGVGLKINSHRAGCYFCKKFLEDVQKDVQTK